MTLQKEVLCSLRDLLWVALFLENSEESIVKYVIEYAAEIQAEH